MNTASRLHTIKEYYSLFLKRQNSHLIVVVVYVDDAILTGTDPTSINTLKLHLEQVFSIKDLRKLGYFLGIDIGPTEGIALTQKKFTKELLIVADIVTPKQVSTPLLLHLKLSDDQGDLYSDVAHVRRLGRKLNFLTNTRLDLSELHYPDFIYAFSYSLALQSLATCSNYVDCTSGQGILLRASDTLSLQAFFY